MGPPAYYREGAGTPAAIIRRPRFFDREVMIR